jgi:hypothetical protein
MERVEDEGGDNNGQAIESIKEMRQGNPSND